MINTFAIALILFAAGLPRHPPPPTTPGQDHRNPYPAVAGWRTERQEVVAGPGLQDVVVSGAASAGWAGRPTTSCRSVRQVVGEICQGVGVSERVRVAAVIQRDELVLMVRERVQTAPGRHDGPEYWTLPGGGIEADEEPEVAVRREVLEEVGLEVVSAREVSRVPYPSGMTTVFRVEVATGEPRLGVDDLDCDCPRMVGLDWIEAPKVKSQFGGSPVPLLIYSW